MTDNKSSKTKVTRIKATDTSAKAKTKSTATAKKPAAKVSKPAAINRPPKKDNKLATKDESTKSKQVKATDSSAKKSPLKAFLGYFAGAWYELKQVRWPNRRATWSLTLAILVFTGFFAGLILLLDTIFQRLFELLIG